jgi:SAM-dependent methyltransferase
VGAGIGTMLHRLLEWNILHHAHYTATDVDAPNVGMLPDYLAEWAHRHNVQTNRPSPSRSILKGDHIHVTVEWECIDLFDFAAQQPMPWDLLLAHALLDLVDLPRALEALLSLLRPDGLFYFTLNFDGITILEPSLDPSLDAHIVELYHGTMDRTSAGTVSRAGSRAGRQLLTYLHSTGASILEAGASDWIIYPRATGYTDDEAYFLHYIIHTIETALRGHSDLDAVRFDRWVKERHEQVTKGELIYIAHQVDVLGRPPRRDSNSWLPASPLLERLSPYQAGE